MEASVPLRRQGQHGGRRQELRHPGERVLSHEWFRHLARVGLPSSDVAAAAAESHARADPVVLVLFHRPAQFAIDSGAAEAALPRRHRRASPIGGIGRARVERYVAVMANTSVLASASRSRAGDFVALMKPRVMALAVFTALVAFMVAPGELD